MNTFNLVNIILARLSYYVSRITALTNCNGGSMSKIEYYVN